MTLRRSALQLSIEREVEGPEGRPERVRLTASFEGEPGDGELRAALERLRSDWERSVGEPSRAPRADRTLPELVEIYRPRQGELVELLRADQEISEGEAELLRGYVAQTFPGSGTARPEPAPPAPLPLDRPLAAMPLVNDRTPSTPRPISELIDQYRIDNLRQAGAVRARRQISYEEYMALKRHFAAAEARSAAPAAASPEADPSGSG